MSFERLVSWRYRLLPLVFLVGLGFPSFIERSPATDALLSGVTVFVLAAAWLALWPHLRLRWPGALLMLAAATASVLHIVTGRHALPAALLISAFLFVVIGALLHELLSADRVGADDLLATDALMAAVSIYMLTAVAWAGLYMIVAVNVEGSFTFAERIVGGELDREVIGGGLRMDDFYYFSVTTLTTAGLGDISPVADQAQFLTALESLVGQLFLVVFVAHLVGLRTALGVERRRSRYMASGNPTPAAPPEDQGPGAGSSSP